MKPKHQKKAEAAVRNELWRKLSTREQMASLRVRRGKSVRQMNKLSIAWSCELENAK